MVSAVASVASVPIIGVLALTVPGIPLWGSGSYAQSGGEEKSRSHGDGSSAIAGFFERTERV